MCYLSITINYICCMFLSNKVLYVSLFGNSIMYVFTLLCTSYLEGKTSDSRAHGTTAIPRFEKKNSEPNRATGITGRS